MIDELSAQNKAPLEDLMIYPFFKRTEVAERAMSMIFATDVKIWNVRSVELDLLVGKMSSAVSFQIDSGSEKFVVCLKCMDKEMTKREYAKHARVLGCILMEKCRKLKDPSFRPCLILVNQDKDSEKGEYLISYRELIVDEMNLRCLLIDPSVKDSGPLYDLVKALATGERGIVPWIDEAMDEILSREGRERDRVYWEITDNRWKVNLTIEMFNLGMSKDEIRAVLFKEVNEEVERYLNMLLGLLSLHKKS